MNGPAQGGGIGPDAIEQLAAALEKQISRRIPMNVDLWGYAEIAAFLKVSTKHVSDRYASREDFPKAIRLPSGGRGRAHPRYKAREVVAWVDRFLEGKS